MDHRTVETNNLATDVSKSPTEGVEDEAKAVRDRLFTRRIMLRTSAALVASTCLVSFSKRAWASAHNDIPHMDQTNPGHLDIPHNDHGHFDIAGGQHTDIDFPHGDIPGPPRHTDTEAHQDMVSSHQDVPPQDVPHVDYNSHPFHTDISHIDTIISG